MTRRQRAYAGSAMICAASFLLGGVLGTTVMGWSGFVFGGVVATTMVTVVLGGAVGIIKLLDWISKGDA